jgi:hypothetical protein
MWLLVTKGGSKRVYRSTMASEPSFLTTVAVVPVVCRRPDTECPEAIVGRIPALAIVAEA